MRVIKYFIVNYLNCNCSSFTLKGRQKINKDKYKVLSNQKEKIAILTMDFLAVTCSIFEYKHD